MVSTFYQNVYYTDVYVLKQHIMRVCRWLFIYLFVKNKSYLNKI